MSWPAACAAGAGPRAPRAGSRPAGKIPGMVMISERPAEIEDRAVPGHWEGDLIIGKNGNKSAVGTLVERSTRFVLLLHLPDGHAADNVDEAMRKAIRKLPEELARSITWDQGKEMADHAGLHRRYRDPDLLLRSHIALAARLEREHQRSAAPIHAQGHRPLPARAADLARIQRSLNGRPRETLGFMKPSEKLAELVALTG